MADTKMSLKLLIDKKNDRVLFDEAGKDLVDFLFFILALPLGTVTGLLAERDMEGCLQNLYKSIENLSNTYLQPDLNKDTLLKPKLPISGSQLPLLLSNVEFSTSTAKFYRCNADLYTGYGLCRTYVANDPTAICPSCRKSMNYEATYVDPPSTNNIKSLSSSSSSSSSSSKGGYVKEVVTYMVMDNVEVKPMSTISSITLLNKFNVKEVGTLEEKVVDFGMDESLYLLKASLQSKTVVTHLHLSITKPKQGVNTKRARGEKGLK